MRAVNVMRVLHRFPGRSCVEVCTDRIIFKIYFGLIITIGAENGCNPKPT